MKKHRPMPEVLQQTGISRSLADAAVFVFALGMLGSGPAEAQTSRALTAADTQVECESRAGRVKAVTAPGDQTTTDSFAAQGPPQPRGFGKIPLLTTNVTVHGPEASCLIAHFSGEVEPRDNGILFQVRVDGMPMKGHFDTIFDPSIPAVFESFEPEGGPAAMPPDNDQETGVGSRFMVAYNFFSRVPPGMHIVEIFFAGCCSANPPPAGEFAALVSSPVLTLEYQ